MWQEYRKIHGPLSYERRFDRPAAVLGVILSKLHSGKLTFKDLMPWPPQENEEPASVEQIFEKIGEMVKHG